MRIPSLMNHATLALLIAGSAPLLAQSTTGGIQGVVTDGKGRPLANARVVFESPVLFQPRTLFTNASGKYRVLLLPVGSYTVRVSREGHVGKTAHEIRVGIGAELSLPFTLDPMAEAAASVEVVASQAAIEAAAADRISVNYSSDQLEQLPISLTTQSVLLLAPGADGGSETGIRGAGNIQTLFRVDGMDIRDDRNGSQIFEALPDTIEDIQVIQSASNARNGRSISGQVNTVTKQGGNTFSGSVRSYYDRPSWTAGRAHTLDYRNAELYPDAINRTLDITLSGPIVKDRLWFAMAARLTPQDTGVYTISQPDPSKTWGPGTTFGILPKVDKVYRTGPRYADPNSPYVVDFLDAGAVVPNLTKKSRHDLRLTGMLSPSHVLSAALFQARVQQTQGSEKNEYTNIAEFFGLRDDNRKGATLSLKSTFGASCFVEANASQVMRTIGNYVPEGGNPYPVRTQLNDGIGKSNGNYWGFWWLMKSRNSANLEKHGNTRIDVNVKTFWEAAGFHDVDMGVESYRAVYNPGRDTYPIYYASGWYRDPSKGATDPAAFRFPAIRFMGPTVNNQSNAYMPTGEPDARYGPAPTMMLSCAANDDSIQESRAIYVNDSWTLSRNWIVMLGLRWSSLGANDVDGSNVTRFNLLEPRFQVKWDLLGEGSRVLGFSANKFASSYNAIQTSRWTTDPWYTNTYHGWTGAAMMPGGFPVPGVANDVVNGVPMYGVRFINYADLTNPSNYSATPFQYRDYRQTVLAKGMRTPYMVELALNYRQNYRNNSHFSMSLTQRKYYAEWNNYTRDTSPESFVMVHDPSGQGAPSLWQSPRIFYNDDMVRTYQTGEFEWLETVSRRFYWGGSFTYRRESRTALGSDLRDWSALKSLYLSGQDRSTWAAEGKIDEGMRIKAYWTYVHPVGRGELSGSMMLTYVTQELTSSTQKESFPALPADSPLNVWINGGAYNGATVVGVGADAPSYTSYLTPLGVYKWGRDDWSLDLKLQWKVPLYKKLSFVGHVTMKGLLNTVERANPVGEIGSILGNTSSGHVVGRELRTFRVPVGYTYTDGRNEADYWGGQQRVVSEFSAGLRF